VQAQQDELDRLGARVLVVSFSKPEQLAPFRDRLALGFEVAADPSRSAYRAYGMLRGAFWDIWHPRVFLKYLRLTAQGMRLERPAEGDDLSQLGGDFVIDRDSNLRFVHVSSGPEDRPPVSLLLAALRDSAEL
jgi:peroxiredoxin